MRTGGRARSIVRRLAGSVEWRVRRVTGLFDLYNHIDVSTRSVAERVEGSGQEVVGQTTQVVGEFTTANQESLAIIGQDLRALTATVGSLDARIKTVDYRIAALDQRMARVERLLEGAEPADEARTGPRPAGRSSAAG
jgi:hypothetical protein